MTGSNGNTKLSKKTTNKQSVSIFMEQSWCINVDAAYQINGIWTKIAESRFRIWPIRKEVEPRFINNKIFLSVFYFTLFCNGYLLAIKPLHLMLPRSGTSRCGFLVFHYSIWRFIFKIHENSLEKCLLYLQQLSLLSYWRTDSND